MLLLLSHQVRKQGWYEDGRRGLRRPARVDTHSVSCLRFVENLLQVGKYWIEKKKESTWKTTTYGSLIFPRLWLRQRKSSGVLCCHAEIVPSVCRLRKVTWGRRQRQSSYSRLVLMLLGRWRLCEVTHSSGSNRQLSTVNCFFVFIASEMGAWFLHCLSSCRIGFVDLSFVLICPI